MTEIASIDWFDKLKDTANLDIDFQQAARWFTGNIGLKVDGDTYNATISGGRIESIKTGKMDTRFVLSGSKGDWIELMQNGTLVRLFRQGKIIIEGDRVCAMFFWKMLWYLAEDGRAVT